jgi:hypothetical protein
MQEAQHYSAPALPPQVLSLLVLLTAVWLLATILFLLQWRSRSPPFQGPIVPHPSQPLSMLTFVALPAFLTLIRLVMFVPGVMTPRDPINSPRSERRYADAPVRLALNDFDSPRRYGYPENTADLTAETAARIGRGDVEQRARAVRDLAWWTGVCPNYAAFALPRLTGALQDPDQHVRSAAVAGLGSLGGHASAAVPALLAARGSSVVYFDYLLDEAVSLIQRTDKWPAEDVCEDVSRDELERRAVQQGHEAVETKASCRRLAHPAWHN